MAEGVEINQNPRRAVVLVGVWIVGNVEEIEDEEVSDVFSEDGADQRDGFAKFVQINVINSVKFAQSNVTGSVKFAQIGAMNSGFIRGEGRANVRRKRANRKARADKTGFSALTAIESDDDEEVNAIETVQEVVEITVDSGSGQERLAESKERCRENEVEEGGENWRRRTEIPFELKEMRD